MSRPTKRYIVSYRNQCLPDYHGENPIMQWNCFAYDAEHAGMRFYDGLDSEGWEIVSIDRPRDGWGKVTTRYDRSTGGDA